MSDVVAVLPSRTLHPRPPRRIGQALWAMFGLLLFVGMFGFSLFWVAPDLWTDWQVRDVAVPLPGARLVSGSCTEKLFIDMCDLTLTAQGGISRTVHYIFGSFHVGGFTAGVVGDPRHPEWLTTDLGLDRFYDRVITLLCDLALMGFAVVAGAVGMMKSGRAQATWRRAEATAVPLQLVQMQKVQGGSRWTVRSDNGRTASWVMPRRAKPYVLGPANRVLGLATAAGGLMPLDAGLRWVDLSAEERAAALRNRG